MLGCEIAYQTASFKRCLAEAVYFIPADRDLTRLAHCLLLRRPDPVDGKYVPGRACCGNDLSRSASSGLEVKYVTITSCLRDSHKLNSRTGNDL